MCTLKFKQRWIRALGYDAKSVSWFPTSALLTADRLDLAFGLEGILTWEHGGIHANTAFPLWGGRNSAVQTRSVVLRVCPPHSTV